MDTTEQFYLRKFEEICNDYNISTLEAIQPPSKTGYPIVKEIKPNCIQQIKTVDINDPAFDKPYSELTKNY